VAQVPWRGTESACEVYVVYPGAGCSEGSDGLAAEKHLQQRALAGWLVPWRVACSNGHWPAEPEVGPGISQ
jgi:hypothetical protein